MDVSASPVSKGPGFCPSLRLRCFIAVIKANLQFESSTCDFLCSRRGTVRTQFDSSNKHSPRSQGDIGKRTAGDPVNPPMNGREKR